VPLNLLWDLFDLLSPAVLLLAFVAPTLTFTAADATL
jgi:hypothetical protein